MATFTFDVEQTFHFAPVEVEAENYEEAESKFQDIYLDPEFEDTHTVVDITWNWEERD